MDQKTHCNMGYGYINMINLESVVLLYENVGMEYEEIMISSITTNGRIQRVRKCVVFVMVVCKVILFDLNGFDY